MSNNFSHLSSLGNRFFPLFFAFFALFPQNLFSQDPVKIFIYAGQSNSQGRSASLSSIPKGTNDANILFAWNIQSASNFLEEGWDTLQPVLRVGSRTTAIHAGELAVGRNLYEEGLENIGIIKVAKSGTSLRVPWNPTFPRTTSTSGTGNGGMYWLMVNYVESKLADLEARGIPYEIEAIFWHQGEADTRSNLAPDYEQNFQQFVDSVKSHLDPKVEVYAVSVYNPSRRPEDVASVRAAQEAVAARNEHVHFIDLDSIYFDSDGRRNDTYITSDGVHFKTPGYFKVGDAFTAAYLSNNPIFPCDTLIQADTLSGITVSTQPTSDCQTLDGRIFLSGGPDSLWYSIDGGQTFQDTSVFTGLAAGTYTVLVQDKDQIGCAIPLPNGPVEVGSPLIPEIQEISSSPTSQCESADGSILVQVQADNPEFSLDKISYQSQAQFEGLAAGSYWVYVREQTSPGCLDSLQVRISKPSFCGPPECEVQTNLALKGLASQSSTRGNGLAQFAIDGDTLGDDNWGDDANLQHTETEVGAWWQVDLQDLYALDTLVIYNRLSSSDFILRRLADFYVFTSSSEMDGERTIEELANDPAVEDTFISEAIGSRGTIPLGHVEARYVLIKLQREGPLHMSEVEIYGCEANPLICDVSLAGVNFSDPSGCNTEDGSILITAEGAHLEYSIDKGITYSSSGSFSNLPAATYHIVVRDSLTPACVDSYSDNPVVLSSPQDTLEIEDVLLQDISECGLSDGRIEIVVAGSNLIYSIDQGINFQNSPIFENLPEETYHIEVRDTEFPACTAPAFFSASILAPADCETCVSENLSLNPAAVASQSTTRGNGFARFAIDGNPIGDDNWGSDANMQHTETAANSWWMVDLGGPSTLDSMVIFNRTTSQTFLLNRLRDFHVFISSFEIDGSLAIEDLSRDPLLFEYQFPGVAGPREQLVFPQVQGRYVLIKLSGEGPLHMSEVEIWGCQESIVTPSTFGQAEPSAEPVLDMPVSLHVSPNPFQQNFELEIEGDIPEGTHLKVLNSMGQVLYAAPAHQLQSVRLGDSSGEGFYWVLIESVSGIVSRKVVKVP